MNLTKVSLSGACSGHDWAHARCTRPQGPHGLTGFFHDGVEREDDPLSSRWECDEMATTKGVATDYWGYLIEPNKSATPLLEELLVGIANYVVSISAANVARNVC